jgi:hypothetical protein
MNLRVGQTSRLHSPTCEVLAGAGETPASRSAGFQTGLGWPDTGKDADDNCGRPKPVWKPALRPRADTILWTFLVVEEIPVAALPPWAVSGLRLFNPCSLLALLALLLVCAGCRSVPTPASADFLPPPPAGKEWKLAWHDEFDGTQVDETKWNRLGDHKRRDGYWVPEDAYLDGKGSLVLRTRKDGNRFTCGAVNTRGKYEHAFGYYVARCKLPSQPGHWPAFWIMGPGVNSVGDAGRDGTEIDIIEVPWRDGRLTSNLHWDGYEKDHKSAGHKFRRAGVMEGWHTFALLWLPNEYVFYVDGQETWRTSAGGVCQVPEFIKLTEEIGEWGGDIHRAKLPDYFLVDYVRVYDAQ